jgi:hypothetical protein
MEDVSKPKRGKSALERELNNLHSFLVSAKE